jgi:hypothetical protein
MKDPLKWGRELLLWRVFLGFRFGTGAFAFGFCLWLLGFVFGFLMWEAFGREKNY